MKLPSILMPTLALVVVAASSPLQSQPAASVDPTAETLDLTSQQNRLTVPVMIDGRGPFPFIVDTGAERTVISHGLAQHLQLRAGTVATVHSMSEVSDIPTVVIGNLKVGTNSATGINAPALDERNLGAVGMLGIDSLRGQRVEFDFRRREMRVVASGRRAFLTAGAVIAVKGREHLGRLLLSDASVNGKKVLVIVDSGSQVTIGNNALRQALDRKRQFKAFTSAEVTSITGGRVPVDYGFVRRINIGGLEMNDVPMSFGEVHPFRQLQLNDRPALLLGMDVLQLFDRVSVDLPMRRVKFTLGSQFKGMIGVRSLDPTGPRLLQ